MTDKPVIGLVQGDPAGIGPELMVKLLSDESVRERARIAIIGAPSVIERGEATVGKEIPPSPCERVEPRRHRGRDPASRSRH